MQSTICVLPLRRALATSSKLAPSRTMPSCTTTITAHARFLSTTAPAATAAALLHSHALTPSSTRTYATASTSPASPASTAPLTWNRFLALRKTRRRISLGSSLICSSISLGTGLSAILASELDNAAAHASGLDPIAILGLGSAALLGLGWLLGPAFGNVIFGVMYRGHKGAIEAKEREFFTRIKRHRVDPAASSLSNPVPDYYGEKIGSVADYRRWLKDQRAYNLKRGKEIVN